MTPGLRTLLAMAATAAAWGCVTTADKPEPGSKRTHYVLRTGERIAHASPLPAQTDIKVEWHWDNGAVTLHDGFRGWDFDGDARYDMVEVLSESGETQSYVYDFDGDGRIDLERAMAADAK